MADLVRIIGSSPYGVSKYQQSLLAYWTAILIQKNHALGDSEGNLLGSQLAQASQRIWSGLGGAGLLALCTPGASGVANVARLHSGAAGVQALIGGTIAELRSAADAVTLDVTLSAPPGSGTRTDMIYLEVWQEEVQPTISPEAASNLVYKRGNTSNATPLANDLVVVTSTETARRLQVRYAIRAAADVVALSAITTAGYAYTAGPVVGEYLAGDGSLIAAQALGTADGYKRAIVLATVARSAGVTTIAAIDISASAARLVMLNSSSDALNDFSASATPVLNQLLALDSTGKYPSSVFTGLASSATDVDTVDTFHANATPGASRLLPLSGASKYPNSVIRTGSGQGLNADTVDTFHAAATVGASRLLALDSGAQFPNTALKTGSGNGLDADLVDNRHVVASPSPGALLALDATTKYANIALKTGSGNGLDADLVDGADTTALAGSAPYAAKLLVLDSGGKLVNSALKTGAGNGIDVDMVDGLHATGLALPSHAAAGTLLTERVVSAYVPPYVMFNQYIVTHTKSLPAGKSVGLCLWYSVRLTEGSGSNRYVTATIYIDELDTSNNVVTTQIQQADTAEDDIGQISTRSVNVSGKYTLSNPANHFSIGASLNCGDCTINYTSLAIYVWYI